MRALPGVHYRSADLEPGRADEQVDVTNIPWPDECVDFIVCSHVLEHVPDDRAAMRELRRILTPDGLAVIEVPVLAEVTVEDPSVVDPHERLRRFGQVDHVRVYGPDVYDRLTEAGFAVSHHDVRDLTTTSERSRFGLVHHLPWADPDSPYLWDVALCRSAG
jgi:SAM-dependent methyltransferase